MRRATITLSSALNESPSEKEGKFMEASAPWVVSLPLNESPSEKEGKSNSSNGTKSNSGTPQ